jgi:hypothetical protein
MKTGKASIQDKNRPVTQAEQMSEITSMLGLRLATLNHARKHQLFLAAV